MVRSVRVVRRFEHRRPSDSFVAGVVSMLLHAFGACFEQRTSLELTMQNRIDRRDFVQKLLFLPVGVFLVRCGSSSAFTPPAPGAAPTVSGSQAIYTSSVTQFHDHTFTIPLDAFTTPPSGGVSGDTSNTSGHTHHVSISMSDLAKVQTGSAVVVVTSVTQAHSHVFTFVRLTAAPSDGGGSERDGALVTP